mmetsp:Transcript_4424/g.6494  ORF Transcript_4424/g.6494 Transcript_4424/m.6494 type:complete len:96 (+) Transcript_4424:763-1050(+)
MIVRFFVENRVPRPICGTVIAFHLIDYLHVPADPKVERRVYLRLHIGIFNRMELLWHIWLSGWFFLMELLRFFLVYVDCHGFTSVNRLLLLRCGV